MSRFVSFSVLGGGQAPPAAPSTIDNTLSGSSLLPTQVEGADYLFKLREQAAMRRERLIAALENG